MLWPVAVRWITRKQVFSNNGFVLCSGSSRFESTSMLDRLFTGLQSGHRASLAKSITLVESVHTKKRVIASKMLDRVLQQNPSKSFRIGLSGPPGAGKSTFIEVLGKFLTLKGHRVAVLAVDPSSTISGGSLLGDKTRMPELTKDPSAFIRPSPARGHLGGVTRSTNEAIVLCEFAGYDVIIVETVGVGQSEYAVTNMVDLFVLLIPPGGGDELQGIKRGIVERADLLVVTKADGDLEPAAQRAQYEYTAALKYMRSANTLWKTKVLRLSSKTKDGVDTFWNEVNNFKEATKDNFHKKRGEQRADWMWTHVQDGLRNMLMNNAELKATTERLTLKVRTGSITPGTAADEILSTFLSIMKSR